MQLDLTRYRQPLSHFSRTLRPDEVSQEGDAYRIVAPVALDFDIHRSGPAGAGHYGREQPAFRLAGTARTELELPCSRCLEPIRMPIDAAFDLRYLPASEMSTEDEREMQDEDVGTSYYHEDRIDLDELLREQFYLALPMKPLCVETCRGLCPQCGTNLNTGSCDCAPVWDDPRLAPLKALKE
jgi:uncharacterized protein